MGRWLVSYLLREGYRVAASDVNREGLLKLGALSRRVTLARDNVEAVESARIIVVSVPVDRFEEVVREIGCYVADGQLVLDICSVKEEPVKLMHKYVHRGVTLGTHPLFGPGARSLKGKKVVLTPTTPEERRAADAIGWWLKKRGARPVVMSPREHDECMRVVLCLTHFTAMLVARELSKYRLGVLKELGGPTFNLLLTLAAAILEGNHELYVALQRLLKGSEVAGEMVENGLSLIRELENNPQAVVQSLKRLREKFSASGVDPRRAYERMYAFFEDAP